MKAYIIGSSALRFWRHVPNPSSLNSLVSRPLEDCPCTREELASLTFDETLFGAAPIRLMVPSTKYRISKDRYKYSTCACLLPSEAFYQIDEHICVASPEFCALQFSKQAPLACTLELCMELCGFYSLGKQFTRGFQTRKESLASIESISELIEIIPKALGFRHLKRFIPYLQNGSRSPMETRVFLLAFLPRNLGGYGLPQAKLNSRIDLSPQERAFVSRTYLECDLHWAKERVIVEYDGHEDHASRESRARDATKRNVLMSNGYTVFTLTAQQVRESALFDMLMHDIAFALQYRIQRPPKDWAARRSSLRAELFKSLGA